MFGSDEKLQCSAQNVSLDLFTVPLKSKLPVSSLFLRDKILVSRDATLVSRESLKGKFWNITKFLVKRKQPSFSRTCLVMRLSVPFLKCVPTVDDSIDMYVRIVKLEKLAFYSGRAFDTQYLIS